ncbi:MAG: 50S ribosomal protein L35 [Armatimonadota bacterium]|jgi:large subunit ribosomal protein L35
MKTKSAAAKRFKRTGSGKLMHESPGRNHLAMAKNAKRQRRLNLLKTVNSGEEKDIETLVPYK